MSQAMNKRRTEILDEFAVRQGLARAYYMACLLASAAHKHKIGHMAHEDTLEIVNWMEKRNIWKTFRYMIVDDLAVNQEFSAYVLNYPRATKSQLVFI